MPHAAVPSSVLLASPEATEQQFYEALQHADLEKLMGVWSDEDEVSCVHPGGPRLVGLRAIRAAFETLFGQGPITVHPERVRRLQTAETAVHQVLERVQVAGPEDKPQTAWVIASNVYVKTALGWRMVLHHASPGSASDVQELSEGPAILH
ncbi:nuclear transport factor 2 family protein [Pelomonas sp. SE-A7]|uniref:YybH family protein n=1 Tax=Pelomonas sp. SE-A7 TaxID=3054953 RepID=UPI00259D0DFC|nr:nuclear transport factor 2 family protein [Pelomonas sp. SE-A7]MDM4768335.1 nuclear transport factor 2 family protein [Pelomonas sp. SE-A7]